MRDTVFLVFEKLSNIEVCRGKKCKLKDARCLGALSIHHVIIFTMILKSGIVCEC